MLKRVLAYAAAFMAVVWAVMTSIRSKEKESESEQTIEVLKDIGDIQSTGDVRKRMRRFIRKE